MKHIKIIFSLFIFSFFLISCEKVIELDLNDAETKLVVEAQLNNGEGENYVILSKSGSFYEANDFIMVKDAKVTIKDEDGNLFELEEVEDGVYYNALLDGQFLKKYTLNIDSENETYTAESTMPTLVTIDSIAVEIKEGNGPGGGGDEESFKISCHFQDPANVDNYYKLNIRNMVTGESEFTIYNDDYFDGRDADLPIRGASVFSGDSLVLELHSLDKANYEFFKLLEANGMSAFSTSVGNPTSNIEGKDVFGVFGATAVDRKPLTIKGLPFEF